LPMKHESRTLKFMSELRLFRSAMLCFCRVPFPAPSLPSSCAIWDSSLHPKGGVRHRFRASHVDRSMRGRPCLRRAAHW
jgi:hypothetical protein